MWPRIAPRGLHRGQAGLHDRARLSRIVQNHFQHASKSPQDLPRTAPSALGAFQRGLQEAKFVQSHCVFQRVFAFSPFRVRWALQAPGWLQDGPRGPQDGAQEGPTTAPKAPQTSPRAAQECPRRLSFGLRRGDPVREPPFCDRWPPKGPSRPPRRPQESPKSAPRGPPRIP